MAALEQQVGEMKVDKEPTGDEAPLDAEDSRPSSGFYELSEGQSPRGLSDSFVFADLFANGAHSVWLAYGERPKSVGDIVAAKREGLLDYIPRSMVPRSFSVPHTSLKGIAEGTEEEPWTWDLGHLSSFAAAPAAEGMQEALRVERYILSVIQRCAPLSRPCDPHTHLGSEPRVAVRQGSLSRKESLYLLDESENRYGGLQTSSGGERDNNRVEALPPGGVLPFFCTPPLPSHLPDLCQDSLDFTHNAPELRNSEADSYQSHYSPDSRVQNERLVIAQYIPGQTCQTMVCASAHRPPGPPKSGRTSRSPDRSRPKAGVVPKKCHLEDEEPGAKKQGRRADRSQSEHSLLGQRDASECKCSTVERIWASRGQDRPTATKPDGSGNRRWRSTQELSQDKVEAPGGRGSRRSHKPHPLPLYPYTHDMPRPRHRSHYSHRVPLCRAEEGNNMPSLGDGGSNVSEGDTFSSSSLSSDSDDSGGLVWPQEVLPAQASRSPPILNGASAQPKAFMKIKASHALKKKILRFRNGSLKVMTTV